MNDLTKNILVFIVIIVVLLSVVQGLSGVSGQPPEKRDYSEFLVQIRSGEVQRVEFDHERIDYGNRQPLQYYTISPETDNNTLIGILEDNRVNFTAQEPKSQSLIGQLLISSFPMLLLIGVGIYFMRKMPGGGCRGAGAAGRMERFETASTRAPGDPSMPARSFLPKLILAGCFAILSMAAFSVSAEEPKRVLKAGIIGCDTSHVIHFTRILNNPEAKGELAGVKVVAAFPGGSPDVVASATRLDKFVKQLRGMDVEIVHSIDSLLRQLAV